MYNAALKSPKLYKDYMGSSGHLQPKKKVCGFWNSISLQYHTQRAKTFTD